MTLRRMLPSVAGLILLSGTSFAGASDEDWEKHVEAGRQAHERGDYPEAERLLRLALAEVEQIGKDEPNVAGGLDSLAIPGISQDQDSHLVLLVRPEALAQGEVSKDRLVVLPGEFRTRLGEIRHRHHPDRVFPEEEKMGSKSRQLWRSFSSRGHGADESEEREFGPDPLRTSLPLSSETPP
jgi:hypothetical protein